MIYLDTSVVLAQLLADDRQPPETIWSQPLVSSRLLEYEVWTRLHARKLAESHGETARALLARLAFLELAVPVLARALEPWPLPVRTPDALHLASVAFLRGQGQAVLLASYDARQVAVARALGLELADLSG
jgi:predicted nucleic acid-binding protein